MGVHQGSVLSPLLFVILMETLSQNYRCGCPWEPIYAHDLVIMDESLCGLLNQFTASKISFDEKGFQVNTSKTKIIVSKPLAKHPIDPINIHVMCVRRKWTTQYFVTTVKV